MAKGKYEKWLEPDSLLLLEAWARDGLTDEQIAHNMGITRETLRVWKNKFSVISATLKRGKDVVDIEVENALLKRALGYTYTETTKERGVNPETGKVELITTKVVTKEVVPDTTAQIFWLKNRRPDLWRDKQSMELSGEVKNNPFAGLTTEQLIKLADAGDDD
ncbi:MAG: helix-turn-helix domain-containing protein [Ruminococcus sp.]|nr:helix-turn-helix domain-containing protein [Ruminococcus sp.]